MQGEPLSLSALAREGRAVLLSVNRQDIALHGDQLRYCGCTVNTLPDTDGRFQRLAQSIVAAIPGLGGYFGVDLILTGDGPYVVDVNPRLTTSYAGLREGLGINAARMVLSMSNEDGVGKSARVRGRPVVVSPAH
jgi:predicted ATP-grasp superfamily ATP-dependent carboligase